MLLFVGSSGAGVGDVVDVEEGVNVRDMGVGNAEMDVLDGVGLTVAGSVKNISQRKITSFLQCGSRPSLHSFEGEIRHTNPLPHPLQFYVPLLTFDPTTRTNIRSSPVVCLRAPLTAKVPIVIE